MSHRRVFGTAARRATVAAVVVMAVGLCAILVSAARAAEKKAAKEATAAATAPEGKGKSPTKVGTTNASYTETVGDAKMEMIWIPAGTFQMGGRMSPEDVVKKYGGAANDEKFFQDEHPVHEVELDGFWMGKFEVTNAQFRKFRTGHSSKEFEGRTLDGADQPVVYVSWDEAKAFCDWLSQKSGKTYTLPTEAQWEYACRAGTEAERYWGDDDARMGEYANTSDRTLKGQLGAKLPLGWIYAETTDGYALTAPVGRFKPNGFALHDMIGNVWEWCGDWYGEKYYGESPRRNPRGPAAGTYRVLRGGSWYYPPRHCLSAFRAYSTPDNRYDFFGFRVVRTQKSQ